MSRRGIAFVKNNNNNNKDKTVEELFISSNPVIGIVITEYS